MPVLEIHVVRAPEGLDESTARRRAALYLTASTLEIPEWHVEIARRPCVQCGEEHGQPYIASHNLEVSASASGDYVAVALSDRAVGVDVEQVTTRERVADVTPLLHPNEAAAIGREADTAAAFTRLWTRKEAYLKATGEGLNAPLDRDDLTDVEGWAKRGWDIEDLVAPTGYAAAVVSKI